MSRMKRVLSSKATLTLGAWVAHVLVFIPLYHLVGLTVAALAILPVVVTGWLFGIRAGLLTGLLTFPLNMLLTAVVTGTAWEMMTPGGLFGTVLILLIGAVVGWLHDLGEQVQWQLAERKRAEEVLKELVKKIEQAKEEWEFTADSLPELICLVDNRGRIIRANRTVETWKLGTVVDVKGREVHELLHPGCTGVSCYLESFWEQAWEEAMRGQPAQWEAYDEVLKRHVFVQVQPWKGEAIGSTVVVVQDITEHKRAEEALKEYSERLEEMVEERTAALKAINEQLRLEITERQQAEEALKRRMEYLAALSQASQAVTASLELDQVLAEIVSLAGEVVVSDYTTVVLMDEAGHIGQSAENLPGVTAIEYRVREEGLTSWIVRSRQAVVIGEIGEDGAISPDLGEGAPRFVNRPIVEAGIKSGAGLPLMVKGRLLGVLYLHSVRPHALDGQLPLLTIFANQVAIAIENARLYATAQQELAERKRAEEALRDSEEKYRTILENIEDGYYEVDLAGNLTFFNDSLCRLYGYSEDELMGMNNRQYMDDETAKIVYQTFNAVYRTGKPAKVFDWEVIRKDGTRRFVEASVSLIRDSTGEPAGFRGIIRDITERKRAEAIIEQMAYHDDLTGLPNRRLFNDRLGLALAHAHRGQERLAVMLLDLDQFKEVNDTLGHGVGDRLLEVVGERLTNLLRSSDTVARMGGDEFMMLLPEIAGGEDAASVAQKILEDIRQPFELDGHELHISTSIGIALYPDDGEDGDTLMKNADIAMYRAKDQGRDNYQHYTPATNAKVMGRRPDERREE